MAGVDSLDNLLRALHNALIKAQQLTEQQHIRQLDRYFKADGTPETITLQVPDVSVKDGIRTIEVPLLAFAPPSAVKIKDFEVGFKVRLLGFTSESPSVAGFVAVPGDPEAHRGPLRVDAEGAPGDDSPVAEVRLTFEAAEPPEAFHRLLAQLTVQSIH